MNHLTSEPGHLDLILNDRQPFGPLDTESVLEAGYVDADRLFDRSNRIYAQTAGPARPTYIIGRKGAGKTAFLLGSDGTSRPEMLRTAGVYSAMVETMRTYTTRRGPLFAEEVSDIWRALFDHVALAYACRTQMPSDRPSELQTMWTHLDQPGGVTGDAMTAALRFLSDLRRRIEDTTLIGLQEVIDGLSRGGVTFAQARSATHVVLAARPAPLTVVMDNLEDLHVRLDGLRDVLAGLFSCVGRVIQENRDARPYGLHICLPSELFGAIHEISANPEKDFRNNHLTIYWTASELLHLAGSRLRLYLATQHADQLGDLLRRHPPATASDDALLRAVLPDTVRGRLGVEEDSVGYIMRHTQLLPRHLIGILNCVFTAPESGSTPWEVTPAAVLRGTRTAEDLVVRGILAAHQESYPMARTALSRLSDRLGICFPASELHKVFNREGIRRSTGLEFGQFLTMLFDLGVLGVKVDQTARYNEAEFQYTFDATLNAEEDVDHLCFHPLFTRFLHERSLSRLRRKNALPTYPYGSDPKKGDYRVPLGYNGATSRG